MAVPDPSEPEHPPPAPVRPFAMIPHEFMEDARLTDADYRVLAALIYFARNKASCWPSVGEIARKVHKRSPRTVQASLNRLADLRYIRSEPDPANPTHRRLILLWRLGEWPTDPPQDPAPPRISAPQPRKKLHPTPQKIAGGGAQKIAPEGEAIRERETTETTTTSGPESSSSEGSLSSDGEIRTGEGPTLEALATLAGELFPGTRGANLAALIRGRGGNIRGTLRGRLDCFEAALREAARGDTSKIREPFPFVLTIARAFLDSGIPAAVELQPEEDPYEAMARNFAASPARDDGDRITYTQCRRCGGAVPIRVRDVGKEFTCPYCPDLTVRRKVQAQPPAADASPSATPAAAEGTGQGQEPGLTTEG